MKIKEILEIADKKKSIGSYADALQFYQKAEAALPENDKIRWKNYIEHQKIEIFIHLDKFDEAFQAAHNAQLGYNITKNISSLAILFFDIGKIYQKQNNDHATLKYFQIATSIIENKNMKEYYSFAYSNLGILFFKLQLYSLALNNFKNAKNFSQDDDEDWYLYNEAECLAHMLLSNEAASKYQQSAAMSMKHKNYNEVIGTLQTLHDLYETLNRPQKKMEVYKQILEVSRLNSK